MKKSLLMGIMVLGMSVFAHAESSELDDEFDNMDDASFAMEIIQDFKDDCNKAGDYYGCFSVAMKYEKGETVEKDIAKAIEYYHKACKLGSQEGCKVAKKLEEKAT
jgi:hypothetical protein